MHVHPPSPPCASPPGHVHPPPPWPEMLVMRKDEAVGNKKKMQVCLPKHNYKLDNNLLTVEPRAVDPHCFDADPDPAQNLDADPVPDPDPEGEGMSATNVHPPWQNPRYAPAYYSPCLEKSLKNKSFWIHNTMLDSFIFSLAQKSGSG
jgi:hypothetical protein